MEDLKEIFTSSDTLAAIGSIIAGIYYGFIKSSKTQKEASSDIQSAEAELIKILRTHVTDELKKNEDQQEEIKQLKKEKDDLEEKLDKVESQLRKHDAYVDRVKYYCPRIPENLESFSFSDVGRLESCSMGGRRKESKPVPFDRRSRSPGEKPPK